MARGFDLTAQINLRGPSNLNAVATDIRRQLTGIQATITLRSPANTQRIIQDIRRQLSGINASVNINLAPNTARNLGNTNRILTTLNRTLQNTQAYANNATAAINALSTALNSANTAANNLPRNINAANSASQNLSRNLNQTANQARQARTEFEEFGRQSALAIRRFAAFSVATGSFYALSNAISASTKEFITFDRELVRIAQVTDTNLASLGKLEKEITTLATKYGIASSSLIQVSTTLAQAGLTARETEKALKALALSSVAPSFDNMNETVEGSIALMRQFGISVNNLESALGSINAVSAKFAVEASDIITAIQRTGGVFAAASKGVSEGTDALNEFIAVFTSIRATTRESAETIATGLRTIFTRIQRGKTIDALKEYGVVLTDLQGKFVGPYEATKRLAEGLRQLDPRDLRFSQIVEELGGFRQIGKVIPLIQQFATAQEALKVAQQGQGSLAKDAEMSQQALAIQIAKVREEFHALIRSIGQSEGFKQLVSMTLSLASGLIRVADGAKAVLPALTALVAIRGISALGQFGRGFAGGIRRQNNGGPVRGFARGGVVPGTGNGDTVPAMLEPGEFVIRKNAVNTIGAGNLHRMNRYALGGMVKQDGASLSSMYRSLKTKTDPKQQYSAIVQPMPIPSGAVIDNMINRKKRNKTIPNWMNFELAVADRIGVRRAGSNKFLDFPTVPGEAKFLPPNGRYAQDAETGLYKGNNNETILAKLVGSGLYRPNRKVSVYYPQDLSAYRRKLSQSPIKKAMGGSVSDTVPALLTPGEFVINKKAASRIGGAKLHQMNRADKIQGFNKGGPVGFVQTFENGGFAQLVRQFKEAGDDITTAARKARQQMERDARGNQPTVGARSEARAQEIAENRLNKTRAEKARRGLATAPSVPVVDDPRSKAEYIARRRAATRTTSVHETPTGLGMSGVHRTAARAGMSLRQNPDGSYSTSNFNNDPNRTDPVAMARLQRRARGRVSGFNGLTPGQMGMAADNGGMSSLTPAGTSGSFRTFNQRASAVSNNAANATVNAQRALGVSGLSSAGQQYLAQLNATRTPLQQFGQQLTSLGRAFATPRAALTTLGRAAQTAGSGIGGLARRAGGGIMGAASNLSVRGVSNFGRGLFGMAPVPPQRMGLGGAGAPPASFGRRMGAFLGMGGRRGAAGGGGGGFGGAGMGMMMAGGAIAGLVAQGSTDRNTKAAAEGIGVGTSVLGMGMMAGGPAGVILGAVGGIVMGLDAYNKSLRDQATELSNVKIEDSLKRFDTAMTALTKNVGDRAAQINAMKEIGNIQGEEANIQNQQQQGRGRTYTEYAMSFLTRPLEAAGQMSGLLSMHDTLDPYQRRRKSETPEVRAREAVAANERGAAASKSYSETLLKQGYSLNDVMKGDVSKFGASAAGAQGQALLQSMIEGKMEFQKGREDIQKRRENIPAKIEQWMGDGLTRQQAEARAVTATQELASAEEALVQKHKELALAELKAIEAEAEKTRQLAAASNAVQRFVVSLTRTSEALSQSIAATNVSIDEGRARVASIASGKSVDRTSQKYSRQADILKNPMAYDKATRESVVAQGSRAFGKDAPQMAKLINFGQNGRDIIAKVAAKAQKSGETDQGIVKGDITNALMKELEAQFGDNAISESLRKQIEQNLDEQLKNAGAEINVQSLIDGTGLNQMFGEAEKATQALVERFQQLSNIGGAYNEAITEAINIEQQVIGKLANLAGDLANVDNQVNETLGKKVGLGEKFDARTIGASMKAGVRPQDYNAAGLTNRRNQLVGQRDQLKKGMENIDMEANPQAWRQAQERLAGFDQAIKNAENGLEELPDIIKGNIQDAMSALQEAVSKFAAKQQKSESMLEGIVTSTPQELQAMNESYAMMDRALKGNLESIDQNKSANLAYAETLNKGGTYQEAQQAAQAAYAGELQKSLKMFDDMAELGGMDKQQKNLMKADMLENMAKTQGSMNPMVRSMIDNLRKTPENDPEVQKILSIIDEQKAALQDAVGASVKMAGDTQAQILAEAVNNFTTALNETAMRFEQAQAQNAQLGVTRPGNIPNGPGAAAGAGVGAAGPGGAAGRPAVAGAAGGGGGAVAGAPSGRPTINPATGLPSNWVNMGGPNSVPFGGNKPRALTPSQASYAPRPSNMTQPQKYNDPNNPQFASDYGTAAGGRERYDFNRDQRAQRYEQARKQREDNYKETKAAKQAAYKRGGPRAVAEVGYPTADAPFSSGATYPYRSGNTGATRMAGRGGVPTSTGMYTGNPTGSSSRSGGQTSQPANNTSNSVVQIQQSLQGFNNSLVKVKQTLDQFNGVSNNDGLSQFVTKFDTFAKSLAGLSIPPEINVKASHKMEVIFNGAEVLAELVKADGQLAKFVMAKVNERMNKLTSDTEGAIA
jgi:TP901 family phage tail tape measure protein